MAYLKMLYRCPTCNKRHETHNRAATCRSSHLVIGETWAVGVEGKMMMVTDNCSWCGVGGVGWALKKADEPD